MLSEETRHQFTAKMNKETAPEKTKVLVVEDNDINVKVITLMLQGCGIKNISVARNGKEALALFTPDLDLVLLDIGLPDMSGIEICCQMRKILQDKLLPIIACTSNDTHREACIDAGMNDFVVKPVDYGVIQTLLQRWAPE